MRSGKSRRVGIPHRTGFTLIELTVSIAILGILAAIALPAVLNARETSRKLECTANLREIILAFHNYEDVYGVFPGVIHEGYYWDLGILPYIEQQRPVRNASGMKISGPDSAAVYRCPSDPYALGLFQEKSYWPNMGTTFSHFDGLYHAAPGNRCVRPADVTDGLSATSAISERLAKPEEGVPRTDEGFWRHRLIRTTSELTEDLDQFANECEQHSANPRIGTFHWPAYTHVQTPNRKSFTNGPRSLPGAIDLIAVTAVSLHRGGVNVAIADGSVRFVADSIDRQVWRALGTRNGNETLSNSAF